MLRASLKGSGFSATSVVMELPAAILPGFTAFMVLSNEAEDTSELRLLQMMGIVVTEA